MTERTEFLLEADTKELAEALFLEHGPGECEAPVSFLGVVDRTVEPADQ